MHIHSKKVENQKQGENLEGSKRKQLIIYKGTTIILTADFSLKL